MRDISILAAAAMAAVFAPGVALACECEETPASCFCRLRPVEGGAGPPSLVLAVVAIEGVDGEVVTFRFDQVFSDPYGFAVPGGSPVADCAGACADLADCAVEICNLDEEAALPALRERCARQCAESPASAAGFDNPVDFFNRPLCEPIVHAGRLLFPEVFPESCAPAEAGQECQERLCQRIDHCDPRSGQCAPGPVDFCAEVTCGADEVCDPANGGCRPAAAAGCEGGCGVGRFCEADACQACSWCWSGDCDRSDGHCTSLDPAGRGAFRQEAGAAFVAGERVLVLLRGSPNWGAEVRPGGGELALPFELEAPAVRSDGAMAQCGVELPVASAASFRELATAVLGDCYSAVEALGIPNPRCDCGEEGGASRPFDASVAHEFGVDSQRDASLDAVVTPEAETPVPRGHEDSGCQTAGQTPAWLAALGLLAGLWGRRPRARRGRRSVT